MPADIAVDVVLVATNEVFPGKLVCSLSPRTLGVLVIPEVAGTDVSAANGTARVSFGRIGIQASFLQTSITLVVTCTAPESGDITSLSPYNWVLSPFPLAVTRCSDFPPSWRSLVPLPTVRVAVGLLAGNVTSNSVVSGQPVSNQAMVDGSGAQVAVPAAECAANRSFTAFRLPNILCAVSARGSNGTEAVLQGNAIEADRFSGTAAFVAHRRLGWHRLRYRGAV